MLSIITQHLSGKRQPTNSHFNDPLASIKKRFRQLPRKLIYTTTGTTLFITWLTVLHLKMPELFWHALPASIIIAIVFFLKSLSDKNL